MSAHIEPGVQTVAFRFGLTGRRWGETGPVVLMLHDRGPMPWLIAQLIGPLVAAGRQVVALDDPTDLLDPTDARSAEYASAALEAAVELRDLEGVVGHGLGAAAAAQALTDGLPAERPVLIAGDAVVSRDELLDALLDRETLRLAA